jgi:hypothetical protein
MKGLSQSHWHYCWRLPCDVLLHTARRYPLLVWTLYPPLGEARVDENVGLCQGGSHRCNLVLATVKGAKDAWAVVTDEPPTLFSRAFSRLLEPLVFRLNSFCASFSLRYSRVTSANGKCSLRRIIPWASLPHDTAFLDLALGERLWRRHLSRYETPDSTPLPDSFPSPQSTGTTLSIPLDKTT